MTADLEVTRFALRKQTAVLVTVVGVVTSRASVTHTSISPTVDARKILSVITSMTSAVKANVLPMSALQNT